MANRELAQKIYDTITAKPELWDQHTWAAFNDQPTDADEIVEGSCGTTMCLAGWACHLSGEKIDWANGEMQDGKWVAHRLKSGEQVEERATQLLDIDWEDAGWLFYAYDEEQALSRLKQVIENGRVTDPYEEAEEPC